MADADDGAAGLDEPGLEELLADARPLRSGCGKRCEVSSAFGVGQRARLTDAVSERRDVLIVEDCRAAVVRSFD